MNLRAVTLWFAALAVAVPLAAASGTSSGERSPTIVFSELGRDSDNRQIGGIDAAGTARTSLTHHGPTGYYPEWAMRGTKVVFTTSADTLWLTNPDGSGGRRIAADYASSLSPSGRLVAGWVSPGDLEIRRVGGSGTVVIQTHLSPDDSIYSGPAWSPDERLLAYAVTTETDAADFSRVYVVASDGTGRRLLSSHRQAEDALPWWSPKGRLAMLGGRGNDLVVLNADGSDRRTVARRVAGFSWSPTGSEIAYVGLEGGIYVTRANGGRPRLLVQTTTRASLPVWGPGRQVAFAENGLLYVIDVRTGHSRLVPPVGVISPSWWPGRRIVFGAAQGEIFTVDPHGHGLTRLTSPAVDVSPQWSPDGQAITYIRVHATDPAIVVSDPNGRHERQLAHGSEAAWAPDSRRIAFTAPTDDPNDAADGVISVVAVGRAGAHGLVRGVSPAWSPDGRSLAYLRFNVRNGAVDGNTLRIVAADGSDARVLLADAFFAGNDFGAHDHYSSPVWSPDGTRIAVVAQLIEPDPTSGGVAKELVGVVDVATGLTRVISSTGATDLAWSPDGRSIASVSYSSGITLLAPDGTAPTPVVSLRKNVEYHDVAWSPDSKRLAYAACNIESESCAIYVVNRDGGHNRRVTSGRGDIEPAWRPA
jgi:Tol biopolymer transport system component